MTGVREGGQPGLSVAEGYVMEVFHASNLYPRISGRCIQLHTAPDRRSHRYELRSRYSIDDQCFNI